MSMVLTCACVNRTRRFLRCVSGNCIGFVSLTLQAANPVILDIACPIEPPADPPINLVTENKINTKNVIKNLNFFYLGTYLFLIHNVFFLASSATQWH